MEIAFTHDIFTQQVYGGVSRYFVELVTQCKKLEPDLNVRIFGGVFINRFVGALPHVTGLRVPAVPRTGKIRKSASDFLQRSWMEKIRPSVIHQTYFSDTGFDGPNRVVITVFDMIHELYPAYFSDMGKTAVLKKKCCLRADKIITISETTRLQLIDILGIHPDKVQAIYLANSLDPASAARGIRPRDDPFILYVGDRHGYKNFSGLLEAYSRSGKIHRNFRLVCFGGGRFTRNEAARIDEAGMKGKVIQISGNDQLLISYYQNARAFIYPSLCEGFGLPLLEAMSCSCPVFCSDRGSLPEVAGSAAIYFDPRNAGHIQEILEKDLFNNLKLEQMIREGIERIKKFSWEQCARDTLSIYHALA